MTYGYVLGPGQARLRRVAAGWTDTDAVTIRRMAADGATAREIADAIGRAASWVQRYIATNKLAWNRKTEARHASLAAASRSNRGLPIDVSWRPLAAKMRDEGATFGEIAIAVGRAEPTVRAWLIKAVSP